MDGHNSGKGLGLQGRNVVKELMKDLTGQGHIVTTDNFYTSVPLFVDLLQNGIMATGTLRADRKYIPKSMFAKSVTKNQKMGWLDYRMHRSRKISCAVWKDKKNVLLLSTHAEATSPPGTKQYVLRRVGGIRQKIETGPMLLQYTQNMRGVDTADQLRGTYSCLTRSHKWWHRIFCYLLDTVVVNSWIIHSDLSFRFVRDPLSHIAFQLKLAQELSAKWGGRKLCFSKFSPLFPGVHGSQGMGKQRKKCRTCGDRTNQMCPGCDGAFICNNPCYWTCHW